MSLRRLCIVTAEIALVVVVASLMIGLIFAQPVLLSFVETGSMSPTLDPGDGFITVPAQITAPPQQGDVITFRAEEIHNGGLVTHRVVGRTELGYITKGDNNAITDQAGAEPPVKPEQVVTKALQVRGQVVVIPKFGAGVTAVRDVLGFVQTHLAALLGTRSLLGTRGLVYLLFATAVVYSVAGEYRDRNDRTRGRYSRTRNTGLDPRFVLAGFAVLLVLGATATMAAPAGPQQFGVVSAEFESDRPDVIATGEATSRPYLISNSGLVPTVVFLEPGSDQVEIAPHELHLGPSETANATLTIHAPPETGYYRYYVTEHRYLAILPTSTIRTLYEIHPWLPVVVIDAMISGAFLALTLPFVGSGRIRNRSRDGTRRSILTRLVR